MSSRFTCLALLLAGFAGVATPQSFTASIRGVVSDPSEAAVPGASVTATDVQRSLTFTTESDQSGRYLLTALQPGVYTLSAKAQGFREFASSRFTLQVSQQATVDIRMLVGATETSVQVTDTAPLLNLTNAELGQVVDNTYVRGIPLIDRLFVRLAFLAPGVTPVDNDPGLANTSNPSRFVSNGVRSGTSDFFVDGGLVSSVEQSNQAGTFLEMKPSIETIQEFKLQTNFFNAEFGNSGGTVVNLVSKSGTNQFHGTAFEYHRRDDLNANSFFAKRAGSASLPDFTQNKYGGTFGGPLSIPKLYSGRNRTFFYTSLEVEKQNTATTQLNTVPTELERRGDFSDTRDQTGRLFVIYNPFDTYSGPNNTTLRRPFPNNVIPASLQSPIARKVLEYYPQANTEGRAFTRAQNLFTQGPNGADDIQAIGKIDHSFDDNQRISGRYAQGRARPGYQPFRPYGDTPADNSNPQWIAHSYQFTLTYTRTHSPRTVISGRYSLARQRVQNLTFSEGFDPTTLGLPEVVKAAGVGRFPRFQPESYSALGTPTNAGSTRTTHTDTASYSVTHVRGAHTIKAGGELRLYKLNGTTWSSPSGSFNFGRATTSENPLLASAIQGNGIASMLLGWGNGGSYGLTASPASISKYYGWYVQEDWKISNKLTLNFGLRYDFELPRTERFDRYSWFDFDTPSPINGKVPGYNLQGALQFTGENQRSPFDRDTNNIQPRIGFAYALNDKTSVRGGYGIYYSLSRTIGTIVLGAPFAVNTNIQWSRDGGITPYATLANPWPDGLTLPSGKRDGTSTFLGLGLNTAARENVSPQYQQWAFSVQRSLPYNSVVEVNYTGTKGTHLYFPDLENQSRLDPVHWSLGRTALNQQVANPFFGVITDPVSVLSAPTVPRNRLLRPFPQYNGLSLSTPSIGNSIYHAAQFKYEKRFSGGFSAIAHYTFAKLIDDSSNSGYDFFGGDSQVQNFWDLTQERAVSVTDLKHRAVVSFNYQLPFGRGRPFGAGWHRALDAVAGGWGMSGVITMQGGYPTVIGLASPNLLEGVQRPNLVSDPSMPGSVRDRLDQYFNVSAFTRPATDAYGTAPRTLSYRSPGLSNADLVLAKQFPIREGHVVEFRIEAFNALNGVVFGKPNSVVGGTTFGQITDYAGGYSARQMQFAVRYDF
jgi:hypothetical protein